jgi:hypothetical protein
MATKYEVKYFVYHNGYPLYIGTYGGSTDYKRSNILSGKLHFFVDNLAQNISEYLPFQVSKEYGLYFGFRQTGTLCMMCYLSPHKPKCNFKYLGLLKYPHPNGLLLDGHTWMMSFEECLTDYFDEIRRYLILLLRRTQIWQPDHLLMITVDQQEENTILNCVWAPMSSLSEFYITTLKQCPSDCYPLELRVRDRGWFFWLKKTAFDSGSITQADITKFS